MANMAFCAICGRYHETGAGCLEGTEDILKSAGAGSPPKPSKEGFRQTARKADRWFLKMLFWAFVVIALLYILFYIISKA
jgi:hypothetical protein